MGKDFTPKQTLESLRFFCQQRLSNPSAPTTEDIFSFFGGFKVTDENGDRPFFSEEELRQRKEFPYLGILVDDFPKLYASLSAIPEGLTYLAEQEAQLKECIEEGKGDKDSLLIRWYEGNLDPAFYYSEHNEDLLLGHMLETAKCRAAEANLSSQISPSEHPTKNPTLSEKIDAANNERSASTTPENKLRPMPERDR